MSRDVLFSVASSCPDNKPVDALRDDPAPRRSRLENAAYPKRPAFFACKFVRLLGSVRVARDLGTDVFALLTVVAHTEDATGYRKPVDFFNDDLAALCGLSLATLKRARDRAVAAGWLAYEQGAKGRRARYFVTVPKWVSEFEGENPVRIPAQDEPLSEDSGRMVAQSEPECEPPSSLTTHQPKDSSLRAPEPPEEARLEEKAKPPQAASDHQRAIAIFCDRWNATHGHKYPFQARDAAHVRNVLRHLDGNLDEFAAVVERYFTHPDPWFGSNGHRLAILDSQLVKFLTDAPPAHPGVRYTAHEQRDMRLWAQVAEAMNRGTEHAAAQQAPATHALNRETGTLEPIASKPALPAQPPAARVPIPKALATPEFCDLWRDVVADPRNEGVPAGDAQAKLEALVAVGPDKALNRLRRAREENRTLNRI